MKVLFLASECVPFIKTGGLADVVGSLPPVLRSLGVDVRVMLPLYSSMAQEYRSRLRHLVDFEVQLGWRNQYCGIETLEKDGITYYFVDNRYYFDRPYVYASGSDEFERFSFFCRAALNCLEKIDFQPDVLHCHDWQSGMVPALLKIQYSHLPFFSAMRTVMTIHNLQYQGIFPLKEVQECLSLSDDLFVPDKLEYYGCANFLKAGLVYADVITTVSPSYAEEITTAYYGERLDGLLRARRSSLHGVLNGIDVEEYNPAIDPLLCKNYSPVSLEGKSLCKEALQKELGLEEKADAPLIGIVSRLTGQKGLDLIERVIEEIMDLGVQLVLLGKGDARYTDLFAWAEARWPGRVAARFEMNFALAHRIYAGADLFLMPSCFEPCGLSQMIALRYGTLPIVRETGGLRDTVLSYNDYTGEGNGFSFFNYNAHDMLNTISRAVDFYFNRPVAWREMMRRGMLGDYSWKRSAQDYLLLYRSLLTDFVDNSSEKPENVDNSVENPVNPVEKVRKSRKKSTDTEKK